MKEWQYSHFFCIHLQNMKQSIFFRFNIFHKKVSGRLKIRLACTASQIVKRPCSILILDHIFRHENPASNRTKEKIKLEKKASYLLGDYDINLLHIDKHTPTQDFTDMMYSNSLFPCIIKPTRVTSKSATLIDNIFCNTLSENTDVVNGILYTDISDHLPIFCFNKFERESKKPKYVTKRIFFRIKLLEKDNSVNNGIPPLSLLIFYKPPECELGSIWPIYISGLHPYQLNGIIVQK